MRRHLTVALLVGSGLPAGVTGQAGAEQLVSELGCAVCHAGIGGNDTVIRQRAPSLVGASGRFDGAYIFSYLRNPPVRAGVGASRMPDFHLDDQESLALAAFLSNGRSDAGGDESRAYDRARRENPGVTSDAGLAIFVALRCGACHNNDTNQPVFLDSPDLRRVNRLQIGWLTGFLANPSAVRPFGAVPGTGSRMPDFRLTASEVDAIVGLLRPEIRSSAQADTLPTLSSFQSDKALRLIRDRWPCLGCHRLNGRGGRIGPDLTTVGARLTPAGIRLMISDPHGSVPGTVMPKRIIPEDRIDLATSYLSQRRGPGESAYLSLLDHTPRQISSGPGGSDLFDRLCANCHGITGNGDGYNARYLPVQPARLADSAYVATRPDDTLFDGIHVGGFVLNKSHLMPGFGQGLTNQQIRSLVQRIRELCRCEGPTWSRDGRGKDGR